ncbi:predicted protein [Naegleria gruberi]|uniref:Predicted protein n=1 Tax=Naegleria gruberi TaxID=5762 RepID=D2VBC2_NAEGR|nr:uncharacterized protein NAEGRDRAFT_48157 [Naegleria gruberi]EFC45882.1 predicted protein [Naegleria gruberi]|eukprot:XP_002678626.1 predicted protein [Naegleria gruberi strain NEG-M]
MLATSSNKSWADQQEEQDGTIVQVSEENGIKTIVEEKIKDGKKVRITKKVKTVKVQKKNIPIVEERRKWKKFGQAGQAGLLPDVTSVGEPIHFEYTNNKKSTTTTQTAMDEQEVLLNRIQMQLAKEATEATEQETTPENTEEDENKLKAPSSNAYVPPSMKNRTTGGFGGGRTDSEVNTTIKVSNLDVKATEQDLRLLFGQVGRIIKVFVPGDRGRNRGFALITYSTVEEAEEAIEKFERFSLNHLLLSVEWSENKKRF